MAARPRDTRRRGWPANLYQSGKYFRFKNPDTAEWFGLGTDKRAAFQQAIEANNYLLALSDKPRLVDHLKGQADQTLDAWLDVFERKLAQRKLADTTRRQRAHQIKLIRKHDIAKSLVNRIDTLAISGFLNQWIDQGKHRMAQSMRSFLIDVFDRAEAEGGIPRGSNPVNVTDNAPIEVKRSRLTLDTFLVIYDAAKPLAPFVRRSMDLAIISAQRREDICDMQFPHIREKKLFVEQGKEGTRLCIPLAIGLDCLDLSLDKVVSRCRDDVVSRYLVHHTKNRTKAKAGDQVWRDTISKGFARARVRSGLTWEGKEPPTFHEIRSLSERLYKAQGNVNTQELLGHKDPRTTATYHDSRGAEWIQIKVG